MWIWVHRAVEVWWRDTFVYTEESVSVCLDWKVLHGTAYVFFDGCDCLSDFSPDPWSPPECGPDESHWSQDALHPGMAVPAWVWNHPFPRQVSFVTVFFLHIFCTQCLFYVVYTLDFKVSCLLCRFQGGKREELIGITYNRLIRMDANTGDAIKTWRFSNMKQWNVNWEIKMVGSPDVSCIFYFRIFLVS